MKPQLETIHIAEQDSSFRYFKLDVPAFLSYWHYHPELELTYIQRGQGLRFVGDHIGSFGSGDLVLLGENLPHNWASDDQPSGEHDVAYVFQFSKNIFQPFPECLDILSLFRKARYGLHFYQPDPFLLEQIMQITHLPPVRRLTTLLQVLHQLAYDQHNHSLSSIAYGEKDNLNKHQSRVSKVTNFILQRCEQPMSLNQMADFCGMTAPSFCRWFKQSIGHSFVHYLNIVRIERACQYLLQSDSQIAQIAYRCGFESVSHFNRTFKQLKKMAPTQYRKKLQKR